ncbi:MAG: hypothetical protein ABIH59_02885 [archaeon]
MKKETKQILSRNAVAIFFSLVIVFVIIYQDLTGSKLSDLYIVLPALFILGEVIRQLINRK